MTPDTNDPQIQELMRQFYDQVMGAFVQTYAAAYHYAMTPTEATQQALITALNKYKAFHDALTAEE